MDMILHERLAIAVLDDDPVFCDWLCATVSKKSDFVLFRATSRDELFQIISAHRIDCVVLDYNLGTDSGLAVKQSLDDECGVVPPIVMLTGDGRERTVIRAFRMGIDDYLPKAGLRPEFFVATVLKVVERRRRDDLARHDHRQPSMTEHGVTAKV